MTWSQLHAGHRSSGPSTSYYLIPTAVHTSSHPHFHALIHPQLCREHRLWPRPGLGARDRQAQPTPVKRAGWQRSRMLNKRPTKPECMPIVLSAGERQPRML